ncbi:MAG: VCBS repeat-containing protein [Planctomycetes bacterium]|nr:VCBS repeat-containing protein [Planctomycetota bacterium]
MSSWPANNALTARASTTWEITFDRAIDPASLPGNVALFGRWSGVMTGTTTVDSAGRRLVFRPSRPFFVGETVAATLSRNVRGTDGSTLTSGYASWFWIAPTRGPNAFTLNRTVQVHSGTPTITYGVHAGDLDRDGAPDLITSNEATHDLRIFKNDGCGTPGPRQVVAGNGFPSPSEAADFNHDGWLDICTANLAGNTITIFLNDGTGNLRAPTVINVGGRSHGITVIDFDSDGWTDIAASNSSNVLLFRNLANGNGTFAAPTTINAGNDEDALAAADANGDGLADLFVACENGNSVAILRGNGQGTFVLHASQNCGGAPFQIAVGDIDADGDCDVLTANRNNNTCGVLRNDGGGNLLPVTTMSTLLWPVSADLADIDGDGDLDLGIASYVGGKHSLQLNQGTGTFNAPQHFSTGLNGSCITFVDFDRDGLMDFIAADEGTDELRIWLQNRPAMPGTQPLHCNATLRVDNIAVAGYGNRPLRPVRTGHTTFFGVNAAASQPFAILLSTKIEPGVAMPFGLANIDGNTAGVAVMGFLGGPGQTNSKGEAIIPIQVPLSVTGSLYAQTVALDPRPTSAGLLFSNPVGMQFLR